MTSSGRTASSPSDGGAWHLWRQDDNGNRFHIAVFATQAAAEAERRRFEALAHKQIYWVARGAAGGGE